MELPFPAIMKIRGRACLLGRREVVGRWPGRRRSPPLRVRRLSTSATVWPDPSAPRRFLPPSPGPREGRDFVEIDSEGIRNG